MTRAQEAWFRGDKKNQWRSGGGDFARFAVPCPAPSALRPLAVIAPPFPSRDLGRLRDPSRGPAGRIGMRVSARMPYNVARCGPAQCRVPGGSAGCEPAPDGPAPGDPAPGDRAAGKNPERLPCMARWAAADPAAVRAAPLLAPRLRHIPPARRRDPGEFCRAAGNSHAGRLSRRSGSGALYGASPARGLTGRQERTRRWRCQSLPCASCSKRACISAITRDAGTPRWGHISMACATRCTSSTCSRPCRCWTARCGPSAT